VARSIGGALIDMRAPYRSPSECHDWRPAIGDPVVVVPSEWAISWGHVQKVGRVARVLGAQFEVRIGLPPTETLYLRLTDMAPETTETLSL